MSYTALDSIQWGGVPKIGVSFGYDSRRSGSAMQYRPAIICQAEISFGIQGV